MCCHVTCFIYHWSGKTDVTLPWVWFQTGLVVDATSCVWRFSIMRFSDVTFNVMKFHIMKRKWCDISGSHSGVFEDLNFFNVCDVFLSGCYTPFRNILVPLCSSSRSRRRFGRFEHWRWRPYDPLNTCGSTLWTTLRHIQKDLNFQKPCVWEFEVFWTSVCRCSSDVFRHWHLYARAGDTSNYVPYSVAVVGLTPPRIMVIVVKLKMRHSLMNTTSHSHTACVDVYLHAFST